MRQIQMILYSLPEPTRAAVRYGIITENLLYTDGYIGRNRDGARRTSHYGAQRKSDGIF